MDDLSRMGRRLQGVESLSGQLREELLDQRAAVEAAEEAASEARGELAAHTHRIARAEAVSTALQQQLKSHFGPDGPAAPRPRRPPASGILHSLAHADGELPLRFFDPESDELPDEAQLQGALEVPRRVREAEACGRRREPAHGGGAVDASLAGERPEPACASRSADAELGSCKARPPRCQRLDLFPLGDNDLQVFGLGSAEDDGAEPLARVGADHDALRREAGACPRRLEGAGDRRAPGPVDAGVPQITPPDGDHARRGQPTSTGAAGPPPLVARPFSLSGEDAASYVDDWDEGTSSFASSTPPRSRGDEPGLRGLEGVEGEASEAGSGRCRDRTGSQTAARSLCGQGLAPALTGMLKEPAESDTDDTEGGETVVQRI